MRVGFDPRFAPLTFEEGRGADGIAILIVEHAFERAGLALELAPSGLGDRDAQEVLRLDGFACMAITSGRKQYLFSTPYLHTAAALFLGGADATRSGEQSLAPLHVVTPGSGPLFELLSEQAGRGCTASVIAGVDYEDCLRRVLLGKADAAALNAEVGRTMIARLFPGSFRELPAPLPDLPLGIALRRDVQDVDVVIERLNSALREIAEGPGAADHTRPRQ